MHIIHLASADYPHNLGSIVDAPKELYIEGKLLPVDRIAVGIVGSRVMSGYGRKVATDFTREFARAGVTLVSGLARGIDSVVHKTAIASGGRTIAVLGSGLDIIYPPENRALAKKITKSGALVSEYKPGIKPLGKHFLARNRIISGLSLAIVVVEGTARSGTISTATHAANQGREVFAVPGPVNSRSSEAPHYLIENGARIAKTPEDILDYLVSVG